MRNEGPLVAVARALDAQALASLAALAGALEDLEAARARLSEATARAREVAQHDNDVRGVVSGRSLQVARARAARVMAEAERCQGERGAATLALKHAERAVERARGSAIEALTRCRVVREQVDALAVALARRAEEREAEGD